MKKTYLKPNAKIHVMISRMPLLDQSYRSAGGAPVDEEGGIGSGIKETDGTTDPFDGHGQGSGGGGTRAKGFSGWDL